MDKKRGEGVVKVVIVGSRKKKDREARMSSKGSATGARWIKKKN